MKSAIGKDLSKIPMPVTFNEPLSFLQRLHEDLEYAEILNRAAAEKDSLVRLALVAAFSSTIYATSTEGARPYKPFNPILGETYEYVDPVIGFRSVSEQVSHHPPVSALHAESVHGWQYRHEYHCGTKFSIRGTLTVIPDRVNEVVFSQLNESISWCKPATTVHNLILGKPWVDQDGEVILKNHRTKERCQMTWSNYSKVGKSFCTLFGHIYDKDDECRYTVHGSWDKGLVLTRGRLDFKEVPPFDESSADPRNIVLWKANPRAPQSAAMFGMPIWSMALNQPMPNICPTDSRFRQDQQELEKGNMDASGAAKHKLEELQRRHRKEREASGTHFKPVWFHESHDSSTNLKYHVYKGGYWDAKQNGEFEKAGKYAALFAI